jgi:hypothetical protein
MKKNEMNEKIEVWVKTTQVGSIEVLVKVKL